MTTNCFKANYNPSLFFTVINIKWHQKCKYFSQFNFGKKGCNQDVICICQKNSSNFPNNSNTNMYVDNIYHTQQNVSSKLLIYCNLFVFQGLHCTELLAVTHKSFFCWTVWTTMKRRTGIHSYGLVSSYFYVFKAIFGFKSVKRGRQNWCTL